MADHVARMDESGEFRNNRVATDQVHIVAVDVLELDHRYHDDENIQSAEFLVESASGLRFRGTLDENGKATVIGVPPGPLTVRFGPDTRDYEIIPPPKSVHYKEERARGDIAAAVRKIVDELTD